MNYTQLLKRAFQITKRYKVLWIFGILLALTSGGGGGGGGGSGWRGDRNDMRLPSIPGFSPQMPTLDSINWQAIAGIILLCCCVLLILAIIGVIVHYVARGALYRSVDQIEATGAAPTWREGFRLGWTNRSFRLWLLDLIVGIPFAIIAVLLLMLGAAPLLLLLAQSTAAKALGVAAAIGLELVIVLVIAIIGAALGVLGQFWSREIALADRSIGQALSAGYALVRSRLKNASVMWLLLVGMGLLYGIVAVILFFVVLAVAAAVGGGLGLLVHTATHSIPWAVAVGLPPFLLLLIVPLVFVQGLWQVFESSAWTLAYREITGSAQPTPDV